MAENNDPNGAYFEIIVDGKPRSYRDIKAVAIEAAMFLKECRPTQAVSVRDLRDGTIFNIGWASGSAFVQTEASGPSYVVVCCSNLVRRWREVLRRGVLLPAFRLENSDALAMLALL
jgi:hypothetical protein